MAAWLRGTVQGVPRQAPPPGHILRKLGQLIQDQRRARARLSQVEFARLVGVAKNTLKQYEQGLRDPPFLKLAAIAYYCDLPISTFLSPMDAVEVPVLHVRAIKTWPKKYDPESDDSG